MQAKNLTAAFAATAAVALTSGAFAQVTIIDNFEADRGRFTFDPDLSGQNRGLSETTDGQGPSTTTQNTTTAFTGSGSLQVNLVPGTSIPAATTPALLVRLQSGGTVAANNAQLNPDGDADPTGFFGAFFQTSTPNLEIAFAFDDGPAIELSTYQPLLANGEFNLIQVDLDNADQFNGFAGTSPNGTIDQSSLTLDSIFIRSSVASTDPFTVLIDTVAFNPTGNLNSLATPIPEPTSLAAFGLAGAGLLARRRKA